MKYTGPEKFASIWSSLPHFIIRTLFGGSPTWAIVVQGEQPSTAVPMATYSDALSWMKDNGFERVT